MAAAACCVKKEMKVAERKRKARQVKWAGDDCMFGVLSLRVIQTITGNGVMELDCCSSSLLFCCVFDEHSVEKRLQSGRGCRMRERKKVLEKVFLVSTFA